MNIFEVIGARRRLSSRHQHLPGLGRLRGGDGVDAQPVRNVLQLLHGLGLRLVIVRHVGNGVGVGWWLAGLGSVRWPTVRCGMNVSGLSERGTSELQVVSFVGIWNAWNA